MLFWLLEHGTAQAMQQALDAGFAPDAAQQAMFTARAGALDGSRIMSVAGDRAAIKVQGVLTDSPDIFAMIFGGGNTTYAEFISAIAAAEADPSIKEIVYDFNSPGGQASALWGAAMDAVKAGQKPSTAMVSGIAASAAYGMAAQADKVIALNRFAQVGSVGVVATMRMDEGVISVTSTEAPAKRPDPRTPEGLGAIRAQVDALHGQFAEALARGRNTTTEDVNANFGRGAMVLAQDAVTRGMIDGIATPALAVVPKKSAAPGGKKSASEAANMDLKTLRAEHPELFAEAVAIGERNERDRVVAHLTMAEQAEAFDIAHKAIREGTGFTATVNAEYLSAGIAKAQLAHRKADEPAVPALPNGGQPPAGDTREAAGNAVADAVEKLIGKGE